MESRSPVCHQANFLVHNSFSGKHSCAPGMFLPDLFYSAHINHTCLKAASSLPYPAQDAAFCSHPRILDLQDKYKASTMAPRAHANLIPHAQIDIIYSLTSETMTRASPINTSPINTPSTNRSNASTLPKPTPTFPPNSPPESPQSP